MQHVSLLPLILAFVLTALPGTLSAQEWQGTTTVEDGVTHVRNPAEPLYGTDSLVLEEVWRLGGFSDVDEEFFGVIIDIMIDEQNNVYLVDLQLSEVKVFDETGSFVTGIGREGEGPGEFRRPIGVTRIPDGRLGVLQAWPSKLVLFDENGEPAGEQPFKADGVGFGGMRKVRLAGDKLAVLYNFGNPGDDGYSQSTVLGFMDAEGNVTTQLRKGEVKMDYANSLCVEKEWYGFDGCWNTSATGWTAARDDYTDYAITVWTPDGDVDRVIHRKYPDHPRTGEEIQKIKDRWAASLVRWVPNPTFDIEKNWNPVEDLSVRPDGSLWVRTSRGKWDLGDGEMVRYDVFDAQGRYLQEVVLHADFDPVNDGLFLDDSYVFVVTDLVSASAAFQGGGTEDDDEDLDEEPTPMEIICYRVNLEGVASK